MSTLDEKQLENAHAFMTHSTAPNWDAVAELLSPEFKHQYFPTSLPENKDIRGKEEFILFLKSNLFAMFKHITFHPPLDVIHGSNIVAFHLRSDGVTKSGEKCNNEFMITFHFEGEKITRMNEFVDSKYSSEFFCGCRGGFRSSSS
ncbi:hypothetical protein C8R43DRAFT_159786 [Mycena crocata]|nr:hypothetical protein C8R43DRAFT_159786 [Mycena crocata]